MFWIESYILFWSIIIFVNVAKLELVFGLASKIKGRFGGGILSVSFL